MNSHEVFIHIHQGCFAGTGAIVRLPQCQWSKPDGYGKISQCITTTKHSKAKTACIFLGIYCKYILSTSKYPRQMTARKTESCHQPKPGGTEACRYDSLCAAYNDIVSSMIPVDHQCVDNVKIKSTNVFLIKNTSTENMSSTNTSKYHGWSGPLLLMRARWVLASSKIAFRDNHIVKYSWHDKYKIKWMDTMTEPISHVYPQGNAAPYRMGIIMGYFLEYGGRILVIFDWNTLPVALVTKQNKLIFYL